MADCVKALKMIHILQTLTIPCLRSQDAGFRQTILIKDHLNVLTTGTLDL